MESHKLALRVEKLGRFLQFITAAAAEVQYSAAPVEQIIIKHRSGLNFLSACTQYCKNGRTYNEAWESAVKEKAKNEGFSSKDMELLLGFGAGFGASDTGGQVSHCRLYAELTAENLKTAKEEQARKSRLYQMLGIFAGVSLSLLLI